MTYHCALCKQPYTLDQPRRTTRYCQPCRDARTTERKRQLNANRSRARDHIVDVINDYTRQGMDPEYLDMLTDDLDAVIDETLPIERAHPEIPLEGALSERGPDEGTSTGWVDLAEILDQRATAAAEHPWWAAHPEWADSLVADEVDEALRAA